MHNAKKACFQHPSLFDAPAQGEPVRILDETFRKYYKNAATVWRKFQPVDGQTDRQTDGRMDLNRILN